MDATNIWIEPKNKRDKKVKKVKDIVKFAIGFTIVKNITAETGERTLYVNIYKPNNEVLTKNAANTFEYENRSLPQEIHRIQRRRTVYHRVLECGRISFRRYLPRRHLRRRNNDRFTTVRIGIASSLYRKNMPGQ